MALRDKACYTLTLVPSKTEAGVFDLAENYGSQNQVARYWRVRENETGEVCAAALYDAFSSAKLGATGIVNEKIKSRRLELFGPDEKIPWEFTGKLGFEWTFTFEGHKYIWKRDGGIGSKELVCNLDRRPDPPVEIARGDKHGTKPPQMQYLHYNIDRFYGTEIHDLRGLETLLALTFVSLTDLAEAAAVAGRSASLGSESSAAMAAAAPPRPVSAPPPPEVEVYVEDANEVIVGVHTDIDGHIARAIGLLEDPNVLFITIRTKKPEAAHRALEVSLGVTRFRHRQGLPELRQYVIEEEAHAESKGPRVIKLDQPASSPWRPPPTLAIYLSSIELPDLKPKGGTGGAASGRLANGRPQSVGRTFVHDITDVPGQAPMVKPSPSPSLKPSPQPSPNLRPSRPVSMSSFPSTQSYNTGFTPPPPVAADSYKPPPPPKHRPASPQPAPPASGPTSLSNLPPPPQHHSVSNGAASTADTPPPPPPKVPLTFAPRHYASGYSENPFAKLAKKNARK